MDERARRKRANVARSHGDEQKRVDLTKRLKVGALVLAAVVAVGGLVYASTRPIPEQEQTVHWHPQWVVIVNGTKASFADPVFDASRGMQDLHMHLPDFKTLHVEGRIKYAHLGRAFYYLASHTSEDLKSASINDTTLVLPPKSSTPGTYIATNATPLRVLTQLQGDAQWTEHTTGLAQIPLKDKELIIVLYGSYTPDQIAQLENNFGQL